LEAVKSCGVHTACAWAGAAPAKPKVGDRTFCEKCGFDILAAVKRTAIPHHATFLGWSLNGVDADSEKRLIA